MNSVEELTQKLIELNGMISRSDSGAVLGELLRTRAVVIRDLYEATHASHVQLLHLLNDVKGSHRITVHLADVLRELVSAQTNYPAFHSAHEGFAILKEEVDELWEEVRKKPLERSKRRLRDEAIQVSAMALRFILDI